MLPQDHLRVYVGPDPTAGHNCLTHGSPVLAQATAPHYLSPRRGGLAASTPHHGWSGLVMPDKQALVTDAGKLFVLDSLLARLKEEGHRVLIYSQVGRVALVTICHYYVLRVTLYSR